MLRARVVGACVRVVFVRLCMRIRDWVNTQVCAHIHKCSREETANQMYLGK